jgi:hypothetical protein
METSPRKPSHWLGQECSISKSSVLSGLKALRFHPYIVSMVQELIPENPVAYINFCHWMLQSMLIAYNYGNFLTHVL